MFNQIHSNYGNFNKSVILLQASYHWRMNKGNTIGANLFTPQNSATWVPRLLSEENKHNRVVDSEAILAIIRRNPDEFLSLYITVDETWIHSRDKGTVKTVEQGHCPNRCLF